MKRYWIRRVRSMWCACFWIQHLFCVAVVGSDQCYSFLLPNTFSNPTQASIDELACFNRLIEFASVSNHVWICEVDDKHISLSIIDCAQHFVGYSKGRHLRLQIVGCDFR